MIGQARPRRERGISPVVARAHHLPLHFVHGAPVHSSGMAPSIGCATNIIIERNEQQEEQGLHARGQST